VQGGTLRVRVFFNLLELSEQGLLLGEETLVELLFEVE
jgi:hypothetical protein